MLVPKSAKQMVVVQALGDALEGLLASLHPGGSPFPTSRPTEGLEG